MCKQYNPAVHWSLDMEKTPIEELAVTETIDCLLLKIHNSNGLERPFCSDEQLIALAKELVRELRTRGIAS
jgi:hypothetical protein